MAWFSLHSEASDHGIRLQLIPLPGRVEHNKAQKRRYSEDSAEDYTSSECNCNSVAKYRNGKNYGCQKLEGKWSCIMCAVLFYRIEKFWS
jgi:hypothetical protein